MQNDTSPDTDNSPESPVPVLPHDSKSSTSPTTPTSPRNDNTVPPFKSSKLTPSTKSNASKTKPKTKSKSSSSKTTSTTKGSKRKDIKSKQKNPKNSSAKTKAKGSGKSKSVSSKDKSKENKTKTKKVGKIENKKDADDMLLVLGDSTKDNTERYQASKRVWYLTLFQSAICEIASAVTCTLSECLCSNIHHYILNLQSSKERMEYAAKFLSHFQIPDDKIRGMFVDFMTKFAISPKSDGMGPFTVIIRPFTQLLVDSMSSKSKKPSTTIKRIIYNFAQIYPVMLARLCREWRHTPAHDAMDEDSDDEDKANAEDMNRRYPKFTAYRELFIVAQKIVDNILLLLINSKDERRNFAIKFAKSVILHSTCTLPAKDRDRFSLHSIRQGHPLLSESALTSKAKAWLKALTDALNNPKRPRIFSKGNCENAIKGLFGIAKERERLRVPVLNSLIQWVDDNQKTDRALFRHNQTVLKQGFIMILKEDTDTRPYHRQCLQVLKALTTQDPSEYREIQKQITLRRRQAASHDQRHIASQKQRTRQREIQLLLELEDEYMVSIAIECCKHFEVSAEERRRQEKETVGAALKTLVAQLQSTSDQRGERQKKQEKKTLHPLQLKSLSENEKRNIIDKCWRRLLSPQTCLRIKLNGKRAIQAQLVAKLYSSSFMHVQNRDTLIDDLTNNFHSKYPIAMQWLYHLAVRRHKGLYEDVLKHFLQRLRSKLPREDKMFTQFIINLPIITDDAIKHVKKYAAGDRITLGLSTMRDIILYRAKHSAECLESLLEYTTDGEGEYGGEVSGPAIRCVVNKLYQKEKFKERIEQFALGHFEECKRAPIHFDPRGPPAPPSRALQESDPMMFDQQKELFAEKKKKWLRTEAQELRKFLKSHSELFFSLCTRKPSLLQRLMTVYADCRKQVKLGINQLMDPVIKYFGSSDGPVLELIRTCPPGGDLFVEHAVRVLTENGENEPSDPLYKALLQSYFQNPSGGGAHVRIWLPIVKYLDEKMVKLLLQPMLGQLETHELKAAIGDLLKRKPAPVIPPSTLLVEIQCFALTQDSPHIEKVMALTNYCLGQGVYDKTALSQSLQQMLTRDPIPVLFMRTLIQALLVFPDLTKFAMDILMKLVYGKAKIYQNKQLWDGFIRCCEMTQPKSYAVLCSLSRHELKSVIMARPNLRRPLLEYASESNGLRSYIMEILRQDPSKLKQEESNQTKQEKKVTVKQEEHSKSKKRTHDEMLDGEDDEHKVKTEPSSKRRIVDSSSTNGGSTESVAAYRVQFFLNKFSLQKMKPEALLKMENFLRHNFANLLKIAPEHIIGVKCHREVPPAIPLPDDTVICEVIMFNTEVNGSPMKETVEVFQNHLQTMDFSSWKIYVGAEFVTIQDLTYQNLLLLLKQLGLTTGGLNNVDTVLKIMEQTPGFMSTATGNEDTKQHRTSKKHRKKSSRHKSSKHSKRSHRSDRKRRKHREESSSEESSDDDGDEEESTATEMEQSGTDQQEGSDEEEETEGDETGKSGDERGSHRRKKRRRHKDKERSRDHEEGHRRERRHRDSRDRRKRR